MSNTKLNQKWTLWYDDFRDENSPKDYDKNLYIISSFDNIEVKLYTFLEFLGHL